jgi:hypothetical protein
MPPRSILTSAAALSLLSGVTALATPAWHCPADRDLADPPAQSGGSLILKNSNARLEGITHHIDVHIEDGFARTTIDQTYFNSAFTRQEGTYYIPLPPDASISRLAMDVNGQLMEGGMAEQARARNVYESIVRKQRDPVLLEWIDGNTFKMRVFPIEPREHKRIILSYTQRLQSTDGQLTYRFPGCDVGSTLEWSARILLKDGARTPWHSESQPFNATVSGNDLLLESKTGPSASDVDIALSFEAPSTNEALALVTERDGHRYAMLRCRPDLGPDPLPPAHHWIVIFEASADRDPVAARLQIEALRILMATAGKDDRFTALVANTTIRRLEGAEILPALEECQLIGALDLGRAFDEAKLRSGGFMKTVVLHLGGGRPSLGERETENLITRLSRRTRYLGAGIGHDWNRSLMEATAGDTGAVAELRRAEDILPLARQVTREGWHNLRIGPPDSPFLADTTTVYRGDEIVAFARLPLDRPLPDSLVVVGNLGTKSWRREVRPKWVEREAGYLPRAWAKCEIDRLVALDAKAHRDAIVALSKQSQVMSPFTSLIVLESLQMHRDFAIEPGGKDHWALYPAPETVDPLPVPDFVREREARKPDLQKTEPFHGEEGMAEMPLEFPKPMFVGTPVRIDRPNLEPLGISGRSGPAATLMWRPMAEGKPVTLRNLNDFQPSYSIRNRFLAPHGTHIVSRNKKVTSSDPEPIIGELECVTDGDKDGSDGSYVELSPGIQWLQIDLGNPCELWGIVLWHFHKNARAYDDVIVQLSDDPEFHMGVTTLFNNDHENSSGFGIGTDPAYIETNHGRILDVPGTNARYLRLYSNGNTANEMNHYIEVEAWGREPGAPPPKRSAEEPSLTELESRVETEWLQQSGLVDLKWLRRTHAQILNALLETTRAEPDSAPLLARGRHVADRWWGIDGGSQEACQLAARLMRALGRHDLEWAYLTTPAAVASDARWRWREITAYAESVQDPALAELARREAER